MRPSIRKLCAWGVCAAVLVGTAVVLLNGPEDPVYDGKRLSEHLEAIQNRGLHHASVSPPRFELSFNNTDAQLAIRSVGTNALPMLVEMLGSTDRIYRFYEESVYRYPWIKKFLVLKSPEAWKRVGCAMGAFLELGPRAAPATPKIIRMLRDPERASVAVAALLAIQPQREEDILSLTNVLRITRTSASGSPPEIAHADGIIALASFGPRAVRARPVLEGCLRSQHPRVRAAAAIALARIGAPADDVLPHVLNELPSVDTPAGPANLRAITPGAIARIQQLVETQQVAIINLTALGEFGPAARAALPMLTNLKAHPDHSIANAAAEAMAKIKVGTNALSL